MQRRFFLLHSSHIFIQSSVLREGVSRAGADGRWRQRSDGTRPGARDVAFPSSRSQLGMRAGDADHQRRRSDGTRPGPWDGACPSPRSQLGTRAGDAGDDIRGYERDEPLRSVLGRADPEQGPP